MDNSDLELVNEIRKQIVITKARGNYMSEAAPVDSTIHHRNTEIMEKLLAAYQAE